MNRSPRRNFCHGSSRKNAEAAGEFEVAPAKKHKEAVETTYGAEAQRIKAIREACGNEALCVQTAILAPEKQFSMVYGSNALVPLPNGARERVVTAAKAQPVEFASAK